MWYNEKKMHHVFSSSILYMSFPKLMLINVYIYFFLDKLKQNLCFDNQPNMFHKEIECFLWPSSGSVSCSLPY